jgi:hypothetical protein
MKALLYQEEQTVNISTAGQFKKSIVEAGIKEWSSEQYMKPEALAKMKACGI